MLSKYKDFALWLVFVVVITLGAIGVAHTAMYLVWLTAVVFATFVVADSYIKEGLVDKLTRESVREIVKEEVASAKRAAGYFS